MTPCIRWIALGFAAGCGGQTVKEDQLGAGSDTAASEAWAPDLACPGDVGCASADGDLRAGAAKVDITPTCFEAWTDLDGNHEYNRYEEDFLDCGCDRLCPEDDGYPGPDEGEGDGTFQAVWLAGFQNARAATGVHDPIWARAVVLEQGDLRVAVVSLDVTGWFNSEIEQTRALLSDRGIDLDLLIVHSTHNHEGPDTFGLWGETESVSGADPDYNAAVRAHTADVVEAAVADLRGVSELKVGTLDLTTRPEGVRNYINDYRDPQIIDPILTAVSLADASGDTIAVLAHTSNHPEGTADENTLISSDFPDQLRETIEAGVTWPDGTSRDGVGGVAAFLTGILTRETVGWDDTAPITDDNLPEVDTELSWLQVGPLQLVTLPGEAHPELAVGGYDGSLTGDPDIALVSADNPAPPDLSSAPAGPYWKDQLPDGVPILLGLGQDELGYIVPPYNFVLDDVQPWFDEAEADHYEETNSPGPRTATLVSEELTRLTTWISER